MPAESVVGRNDPCPCGSGKKYKKCCQGRGAPKPARADGTALDDARRRAREHFEQGRLVEAETLCRTLLNQAPDDPEIRFLLGETCSRVGRLPEAIAHLERAVHGAPDRAEHHYALAKALAQDLQRSAGLRHAKRALEIEPRHAPACCIAAWCLELSHDLDEAQRFAVRALELEPGNRLADTILAKIDRRQGRLEEARRRLEAVLAHHGLADDVEAPAQHELGVVLDKLREYDGAARAFERAGAAQARGPAAQRLDLGFYPHRIARYRAGITPELLAESARRLEGLELGPAPAFLVGFPRSGTTMTEQILGAHPDITTTDEEDLIQPLRTIVGGSISDPDDTAAALRRLDGPRILELRARYWEEAERTLGVDPTSRRLVDKFPLNLIELGLINVVFPDAPIIVALRDPRDVCLSCWMQYFGLNEGMVHFLDLDRTTAFYRTVMGLWLDLRERVTLRFVEVRYEDTVTDLATQARRIIDLMQLPWSDELLRFHEKTRDREISTPSYEAVTKPVHTGAIGRWHHYRAQLEPWLDRLAPFVDAFGYEPAALSEAK